MNWDAYYAGGYGPNYASAFAKAVLPLLTRGASVLDVGCGNGIDTLFFADYGMRAHGVDPSEKGIRRASLKPASAHAKYSHADAVLALSTYWRWDAIYMRWFLHAIPPEDQNLVLKLAATCLKPGGFLAIEARSTNGDHPEDHSRWPVDPFALRWKLETIGLTVDIDESRDYSPMGDDRPLLLRCIARLETEGRRRVADGAALTLGRAGGGEAVGPLATEGSR